MKEVVYLFKDERDFDLDVDAFLFPIQSLSCRSMFEKDLDQIIDLKRKTHKKTYLLCDGIILEEQKDWLVNLFHNLVTNADLIFFSDFIFIELAKKYRCLDKLCYYSPTLCLNKYDINVLVEVGITNFIISKESEYEGYLDILSSNKDVNFGMLSYGYPQIYFSKRKMISSFKEQYHLEDMNMSNLSIVEKNRSAHLPIYEDDRGTYIFADSIFFPGKYLHEFSNQGMNYFVVDTYFIKDTKKAVELVRKALNGIDDEDVRNNTSTFMMFKEIIDNYEKN